MGDVRGGGIDQGRAAAACVLEALQIRAVMHPGGGWPCVLDWRHAEQSRAFEAVKETVKTGESPRVLRMAGEGVLRR